MSRVDNNIIGDGGIDWCGPIKAAERVRWRDADMKCSKAKSDMTPCVLKDGPVCFAMDTMDRPVCVGCGRTPEQLGVDPPKDWVKTVADDKKRRR